MLLLSCTSALSSLQHCVLLTIWWFFDPCYLRAPLHVRSFCLPSCANFRHTLTLFGMMMLLIPALLLVTTSFLVILLSPRRAKKHVVDTRGWACAMAKTIVEVAWLWFPWFLPLCPLRQPVCHLDGQQSGVSRAISKYVEIVCLLVHHQYLAWSHCRIFV